MRTEPWLVPGAIRFLRSFIAEHPGCNVLEFGGGASTIWFLRQDCNVVSFEHKLSWRERIIDAAANRQIVTKAQSLRLDLRKWHDDVPARLLEWFSPDSFDFVLVDGQDRWACLHGSAPLVRSGGVLMLDNAVDGNAFAVPEANVFPTWDWTCCVQGMPDKYNNTDPSWERGWSTAWWQRPGLLDEATYWEVFSEHLR